VSPSCRKHNTSRARARSFLPPPDLSPAFRPPRFTLQGELTHIWELIVK
jgi:hypothetical protein